MFAGLGGWHVLLIVIIVLLLFGATKLPALARSVGQSARILKKEIRETTQDSVQASPPVTTDAETHPAATPPRM